MAQPPAYNRDTDFARNAGNNTDHNALNAELDRASNSINDIRFNLAILQADDGRLRPDVVTYDSISPELVSDISADVRADVQDELDRAEVAADRAEAIAAILDIREAERIAGQIREDAANAGEAAINAENFATSAAESAAVSASGSRKATATGTPDAMEAVFEPPLTGLTDGMTIVVVPPAGQYSQTAVPTLKVDNFAALPVRKGENLDLAAGDIAGQVCQFHYRETGTYWELQNPAWGVFRDGVPVGTKLDFFGSVIPPGYLGLYDAPYTISRAMYPDAVNALWCGVSYNADADYFYRCDNADGSGRNVDGEYLVMPVGDGYFVRGRDSRGAVHPYKYQDWAIENITGGLSLHSAATGTNVYGGSGAFSAASSNPGTYRDGGTQNPGSSSIGSVSFNASRIVKTANETRPMNLSVARYIIKAWDVAVNQGSIDVQEVLTALSLMPERSEIPALASGAGMPGNRVITFTFPGYGKTYTAPADGWVVIFRATTAAGQSLSVSTTIPNPSGSGNLATNITQGIAVSGGQGINLSLAVRKGNSVSFNGDAAGTIHQCNFVYANGVPA